MRRSVEEIGQEREGVRVRATGKRGEFASGRRSRSSLAYSRAVQELQRIWEASNHQETKALQFLGILVAGFTAAAGAALPHVPPIAEIPLPTLVLMALGSVVFFVGSHLLYETVFRSGFDVLDLKGLKDQPQYLADDEAFERESLEDLVQAYEKNVVRSAAKAYRIHRAGQLLMVSVGVFILGVISYSLRGTPGSGGQSMSGKQTHGQQSSQPQRPSTQPPVTSPPSGPDHPLPAPAPGADPGVSPQPARIGRGFGTRTIWKGGKGTPKPARGE